MTSSKTSANSFVRRVRSQLESLSAAERRLADFMLEFPGELASYAASELAALAGVSNATVSRFIRRLGYASYEEAKRDVRREKESGSPLFQAVKKDAGGQVSLIATHLEQSQSNLARTFAQLSDEQMQDIVTALVEAPRVLIFGTRGSHGFVRYLRWQMLRVLPSVVAMPEAGESLAEHLAGLTPQDCLVVFGIRRQTRQISGLLEVASKSGCKILFICDAMSPDRSEATWSIQCQCAGPGLLDNHVSVMALCDLVASMVMEGAGAAGRKRLASIELLHEDLEEL
ncbi:MAG: MurR/RpiR family transcriptional regulator [Comamonas sp.]|jgi:DNA-binding MurR/RpiR family transcriptional regulator|uniref:MurR/RpiR family transcriptional regulator n=1 Tax=Comamonas sp. TaxID=34028 RepID=UPI00283A429A|nr:MurR/RpiR family transcriptional regulator [Comamonas sp.]MDR0215099.1 MurR/RpiR family transcriptional regulator [Comamonas sp.]